MRDEKLDELLGDECRCNQHGDCFDCTLRAHIEQHYVPIADYDDQRENLFAVKLILVEALGLEGDPNDIRLGDVVDAVRARVPIANIRERRIEVLAWLGCYRDGLPPDAVDALQAITDNILKDFSEAERGETDGE